MIVTDCHHEKTAVQKREHAKKFRFLGKVCKRPTSTYIRPTSKKCKKARKLGRKDGSAEKGTRKKIFAFWERFVFDLHRPTFDLHQKDAKKPEKLGECRCMNLIFLPYACKKKSNFSST